MSERVKVTIERETLAEILAERYGLEGVELSFEIVLSANRTFSDGVWAVEVTGERKS